MEKFIFSVMATVTSGTIVFIVGQIIVECFVKPMQEFKKIKSEISYLLVLHANKYHNPIIGRNEKYEKSAEEIRTVAAKLEGFKQIKPFFARKDNIEQAKRGLIGISNGFCCTSYENETVGHNREFEKDVKEALHLK